MCKTLLHAYESTDFKGTFLMNEKICFMGKIKVTGATSFTDLKIYNGQQYSFITTCKLSSRLIYSFDKHNPGRIFFCSIQNIAAKEELKNIPSMIAKAIRRVEKLDLLSLIHFLAQSDFFCMLG